MSAMTTPQPDEPAGVTTLKSMIEESNQELDRQLGPAERSPASWRWKQTASIVRTVRAFHYLKEEPADEAVEELQRTRSKTFVVKDRSIAEDGKADLALVEAHADEEEEEEEHLKPLALKFRLAASFMRLMVPWIFKANGVKDSTILGYIDLQVKANETPVDGFNSRDVVIDAASEVWVRIFAPSAPKQGIDLHPVVVYFHGGGFAISSPASSEYDTLGRKVAKVLDAVVVSVNYRLSPDSRHCTQYDDCFKALQWLQSASPESLPASADLSKCFLAGDSAGGNIVHHVACIAASRGDLGPVKIRGLIMLQPFFGGVQRTRSELSIRNPYLLTNDLADWFWRAFLPSGADRDHAASNVFGPNAPDISGLQLPPILLVIGTHDILKDREVAYAKSMAKIIGKDNITVKKYSGGFHGFFAFDQELQKILMADMAAFVKRVLE